MVELNAYLFATAVAPLRLGAPLTLNPIVFSLSFRRPRRVHGSRRLPCVGGFARDATRPPATTPSPRPPPRARRSDPIPSFLLIGPSVFFSFVSGPFYLSFSRRNLSPPNNGAPGRLASYLPFQQVPQLEILSRPWRHIHRHAPVVNVDLDDFSTSRRTAGLNTSRSRSPAAGRIAPHPRWALSGSPPASADPWPGATPYSSSRLPTRERSISPCPMTVR